MGSTLYSEGIVTCCLPPFTSSLFLAKNSGETEALCHQSMSVRGERYVKRERERVSREEGGDYFGGFSGFVGDGGVGCVYVLCSGGGVYVLCV